MPPQRRILIIEDEEILAGNLRDYFLKHDAEVRIVGSGEAAIGCALEFRPDLLIADFALPGRDGLATARDIRRIFPQVRWVLMTGHPTDSIVRAARDLGVEGVLEKPFPFSTLEAIIPIAPTAPLDRSSHVFPAFLRRGERRHPTSFAVLPLLTADGWVTRERRNADRRAPG